MRKIYLLTALLLLMSGMLKTNANIIIVDNAGDGSVMVHGTLRWALYVADTTAGADTINFNIAGVVPILINISFGNLSLDSLMKGAGTFIDGSSQPNLSYSGPSPKIVVKNVGPISIGLSISPPNVKVCGLYITGFNQCGIQINPTAFGYTIGGLGKKNVINNVNMPSGSGIIVNAGNGKIQNNWIGIDTTGLLPAPTGTGITVIGINASNTLIGSPVIGLGNVIGGQVMLNKNINIMGAKNCTIQGNKIGTDINGNRIVGSDALYGIYLKDHADSCTIGGGLLGQPNMIGYNMDTVGYLGGGVMIDSSYFVTVSHNSIFCNGHLGGIVLINNGNNGILPPHILTANSGGAIGTADPVSTIELFYNHQGCSVSTQSCSGKSYIGSCTSDLSGNWTYNGNLDASQMLVVTQTDGLEHNTSAFSLCSSIAFTVDVPEITSMGAYSIYPNPFSSNTEIKVDAQLISKGCELKIMDVYGREVRKVSITNALTTIAKDDLAAGIYIYTLMAEGKPVGNGKLVVE